MDNLNLISAIGKNNELGKDNKLLWHIPEDLKFFKNITLNKNIIKGINTYYSLPKVLPQRTHIVLTHQNINLDKDIKIFNNLNTLLKYCSATKEEFFVIGGAQIYEQMLNYVSKMYLTEILTTKEADVYFPSFKKEDWTSELLYNGEYKQIKYKRLLYKRKK